MVFVLLHFTLLVTVLQVKRLESQLLQEDDKTKLLETRYLQLRYLWKIGYNGLELRLQSQGVRNEVPAPLFMSCVIIGRVLLYSSVSSSVKWGS